MISKGLLLNNRYEVIDKIGSGGMADVYLGLDKTNKNRKVAIKILKNDSKVSKGLERFQVEAKVLSEFNSPNIIRAYDAFRQKVDDQEYEVMVIEYIEGSTLKEIIESKGVVAVDRSIYYIKQILFALREVHDKDIYHRDLKPQNIMVGYDNTVKLMDFGIAKKEEYTKLTRTGKVIGSVQYLAPEVLTGSKASEQSDIYAVGIMLFELLSGNVTFEGKDLREVAQKHMNADVPDLSKKNEYVDEKLVKIIDRSLAKTRESRYKSVDEFIRDIKHWEKNEDLIIMKSMDDKVISTTRELSESPKEENLFSKKPIIIFAVSLVIVLLLVFGLATLLLLGVIA